MHPFAGKTIPRIVFWPGSYPDAALAVVAAPSSPERAVGGDAGDLLIWRDLAEQFGQHRGVARIAAGDFNSPNLQCLLVDPDVDLAPGAAFCTTVLACSTGNPLRKSIVPPDQLLLLEPGVFSDPPHRYRQAVARARRPAAPSTSCQDRTRSPAIRGVSTPRRRWASSASCRPVCLVCSSTPDITLDSRDESLHAICATEPRQPGVAAVSRSGPGFAAGSACAGLGGDGP